MAPQVVFDTNAIVSALLFRQGSVSTLRSVWAGGLATPVVHRNTVSEMLRVLAYPKFRLSSADRNELLGEFLPHCRWYTDNLASSDPICVDLADQIFIDLTHAAEADFLVTGDKHIADVASKIRT